MTLSIRSLLMITFLIIILILISSLGFITYNRTKTILINDFKNGSLKTMNNAYQYFIENYIDENERTINLLLADLREREVLNESDLLSQNKDLWQAVQKYNSNIWYIYIGTVDGNMYVYPDWTPPANFDLHNRPWYQTAMKNKGQIVWSEPYLEYTSNKMVVSTCVTISNSNKVIGVLSIDTSLDKLNEIIGNMDFGENSYAMLIDSEGHIISHPDSSLIGAEVKNEKWYSEFDYSDKGVFLENLKGRDTFISYINIPETGWKLLAFIPKKSIAKSITPIRNKAIMIGLFGILITILISYLISNWYTKKMDQLLKVMTEVENGNFNVKYDPHYCKEFNDLSQKFTLMVDKLDKTEKRLTHLSYYDTLTDVYNRNYFEEKIKEIEKENVDNVGVMIFDVDGLKLINDSFGHDEGDQLLISVVDKLKESIPDNSMLFRTGGDEFALLILQTNQKALEKYYLTVKENLNGFKSVNNIPVSVSIGFSITGDKIQNINEAYLEADNYMYREKLHKNNSARNTLVKTLLKALETRDYIIEGHGERMQRLVVKLGRKLGFSDSKINDLCLYAQFHDVGKVGIPDRILYKEGPLTEKEKEEMQKHSEMGYRIAMSSRELSHIADWILKHHEYWNGQGYPLSLKKKEIPIESRLMAIVDAYDAMISDRPYRKAFSPKKAVREIKAFSGIMFDPDLVDVFVDTMKTDKIKPELREIAN